MKKRTGRYNGIRCRKWRVTWTVLILIISLISVSATGSENGTDSNGSSGVNLGPKIGADKNTDNQGSIEEDLETKTGADKDTENQEGIEEQTEQKQEASDGTENKNSTEENLETKKGVDKDTENQESIEEQTEQKQGASDGTENKNSTEENLETKTGVDKDKENQESIEEDLETKTGVDKDTENQESTEEDLETKIGVDKDTENQGSIEEQTEQKQRASDGEDSKGSAGAKTEIKTRACNAEKSLKTVEVKTETKIRVCNAEKSLKSEEVKTETKTRACYAEKSLESGEVGAETKTGTCNGTKTRTCNGTKTLENGGMETETETGACNGTYSPGSEEVTSEIKPEASNWNKIKLILAYPYSIHSFYTSQEKVEIRYKGPETFGQQKVDVYLVKELNPSFPEKAVTDVMDENTLSFEDVVNKNTESYIQIPATLNEDGDLPAPLSLGPLPAGSYWVLITLAENETKTPEPEKKILSANYFEVLEYEMEAKAPATLEEGENFEVNLALKNAPAQESYTYWAVLIKEDAYRANINVNSSETKARTEIFLKGLDIIKNFGINSTNYESGLGKEELKSEIQTLIGEGNGTISIGEENQSTLSLTSLGLPPGDYLLFAGAYEKNKGLVAIAQKELTISAAKTEDSDSKSYSSEHNSNSTPSIKSKAPATPKTKTSILETAKTFEIEDLQPHIQGKALVEVIKNPPKIPSFLIGFAGTLLIGLAILKIRG